MRYVVLTMFCSSYIGNGIKDHPSTAPKKCNKIRKQHRDPVVWSLQPPRKKRWQLVSKNTTIDFSVAALSLVEDGRERYFQKISVSIDKLVAY
jgi:hypothetical protein